MNALSGGKHSHKPQSGLESLASSFLGGQHHGSGSQAGGGGSSGGGGGLAGQLIGGFLGGGSKPQGQSSQNGSSGFSSSTQHHSSGLSGAAASFFGGGHGSSVRIVFRPCCQKTANRKQGQNNYGYTSTGGTNSGGYTGSAPPSSYTPSNQSSSQFGQAQHPHKQEHQTQLGTVDYSQQQRPPPPNSQSYATTTSSQWGTASPSQYGQINRPYGEANQHSYGQPPGSVAISTQNPTGGQSFSASSSGQPASYQNLSYQGQYNQYTLPPSQSQNPFEQFAPQGEHAQSFPPPPARADTQHAYSSPRPPPQTNAHAASQGVVTGQGPTFAQHAYPGQQSYGQPPQAHGYPSSSQSGGHSQDVSQYAAYGAPPPPAWR